MAMIWVYAGDRPDRIVMDETLCHPEKAKGNQGNRGSLSDSSRKKA